MQAALSISTLKPLVAFNGIFVRTRESISFVEYVCVLYAPSHFQV